MENLAASLFGLIKTNGGLYKSEKQGAFLLSKAFNRTIVCGQDYHFGEYEGRTSRNTAKVTFEFILGSEGIMAVYKTTKSAGRALYWMFDADKVEEIRTKAAEEKAAKDARKAKQTADIKALEIEYAEVLAEVNKFSAIADTIPAETLAVIAPNWNTTLSDYAEYQNKYYEITK